MKGKQKVVIAGEKKVKMVSRRELWVWRVLSIILLVAVIALAIALGITTQQSQEKPTGTSAALKSGSCSTGTIVKPREFDNPTIFDDLSTKELLTVKQYLNNALGLVPFEQVSLNKNITAGYIFAIELNVPNKDEVLIHLEESGNKPIRQARVVVYRGDKMPPTVEEYIVGPLPNPTKYTLYHDPLLGRKAIPFNSRPVDKVEVELIYNVLMEASKLLYPVMIESFGAAYHNCTSSLCLAWHEFAPRGSSGQRRTLFAAFYDSEGFYLRPTGLFVRVNHEGTDFFKWKTEEVFYNNQKFDSVQLFLEAYNQDNSKITKIKLQPSDSKFYSYKRRGSPMSEKPQMGPKLYEPEGKRYKVSGRHIEYMGWSFDFRSRFAAGLQLFNVKFRGDRIVYELSLQEACVFYSGYDILQSTSNYWDASWLMGSTSYELMAGVDCPESATFFDVDIFANTAKPIKNRKSICVFELYNGMPLRRHFTPGAAGGFSYYGGVPDNQLVIRQIATVWNYDYVFDYIFHLNGAIEVKASATGYPQTTLYSLPEDAYGHRLNRDVVADYHMHAFHYKVDVDILGRNNSFETLNLLTENITNSWYPEMRKIQVRFEHSLKNTELEAAYKYDFDNPKYCIFYNDREKNEYGTKRGYRLKPQGIAKFLQRANPYIAEAASWADYQVAVSKYKAAEQSSTSMFVQNDIYNPVMKFKDFIVDNENIVDQDLVAWVTLATHHIPHAEDAPSTQTAYNSLNFFLYPYNYFNEDPSVSSTDNVFVTPGDDNFQKVNIERYGTSATADCAPNIYKNNYNGTQLIDD